MLNLRLSGSRFPVPFTGEDIHLHKIELGFTIPDYDELLRDTWGVLASEHQLQIVLSRYVTETFKCLHRVSSATYEVDSLGTFQVLKSPPNQSMFSGHHVHIEWTLRCRESQNIKCKELTFKHELVFDYLYDLATLPLDHSFVLGETTHVAEEFDHIRHVPVTSMWISTAEIRLRKVPGNAVVVTKRSDVESEMHGRVSTAPLRSLNPITGMVQYTSPSAPGIALPNQHTSVPMDSLSRVNITISELQNHVQILTNQLEALHRDKTRSDAALTTHTGERPQRPSSFFPRCASYSHGTGTKVSRTSREPILRGS
jgi:hypothetical protein